MTLKLTMMLGPRETIEMAEVGMPDMPGVLWAAGWIETWDPAEVERVLMAAGDVFRQAIAARKHEEPPPPPKRALPEVEEAMQGEAAPMPALVRDTWGDPTPAERLLRDRDWPETEILGDKHDRLFNDILRELLGPPLFEECSEGVRKARRIMRVVAGP